MNTKLLLGSVLILLILSLVHALSYSQLESYLGSVNLTELQEENKAVSFLVKTFGNEKVVLNLESENISVLIDIQDGKIVNISKDVTGGTLELDIKNATVLMDVFEGKKDPRDLLDSGDIDYKGLTTKNKIKYGFLKFIYKIYSFFKNLA